MQVNNKHFKAVDVNIKFIKWIIKKKQNYNNLIERREDWKKKKKHKRIPVFSVKNKSSFLMRKNYTSRREEEIKKIFVTVGEINLNKLK